MINSFTKFGILNFTIKFKKLFLNQQEVMDAYWEFKKDEIQEFPPWECPSWAWLFQVVDGIRRPAAQRGLGLCSWSGRGSGRIPRAGFVVPESSVRNPRPGVPTEGPTIDPTMEVDFGQRADKPERNGEIEPIRPETGRMSGQIIENLWGPYWNVEIIGVPSVPVRLKILERIRGAEGRGAAILGSGWRVSEIVA